MKYALPSVAVTLVCGLTPSFAQTANPSSGNAAESSSTAAPLRTAQANTRPASLEEVIVTAEKTAEPLLTVPVPVTAVSADTLLQTNLVTLQSYFQTIPSVNIATNANGTPQVSIRGLTTGAGIVNPVMSFTIDGIQFGSSSGYGGSFLNIPDIDPSNLARIEVLEGPQGTLYGSDSLGGLINYVTLDPSLTQRSGRVEAGLASVQNAGSPAYDVRGAANLPLSDSVGLRVSAFVRETPGYIDNVATGKNGTNRVDAEGGYFALLIRPSDGWSLKLSGLYQNNEAYGLAFADPTLGLHDLKQYNIPGTGLLHQDSQAYSAIFKAQLGRAELTSLTAYSISSSHQTLDDTYDFGVAFAQPSFGVGGAKDLDAGTTKKFSEEVRLSMPVTRWLDWMVGLYYTYEDSHAHQQIWGADPATGEILPSWNLVDATWPTTVNEKAAFTNLTVHFSDRFDVQLGGRESESNQTYSEVDGGGFSIYLAPGAPNPYVTPQSDTKDSAFTYLVTPRLRLTPDVMVYGRVATGFRVGGPTPTCTILGLDIPCHFGPDRIHDYEIGLKGDFLDHKLTIDTSIFYMPWKSIQLPYIPDCGCASVVINGGDAKSQGVELKIQGRPTSDLMLSGWFDYNDATLTSAPPPGVPLTAKSGTALPYSSKYSAHLDAQQNFQVSSAATLFIGAQSSYVGRRANGISDLSTLQYFPGYVQTDLRSGLLLDDWQITLYANNVANIRGQTGSIPATNYYAYIQPRTVGVTVVRNF
jgi:iron complex outermembrane recepter protein